MAATETSGTTAHIISVPCRGNVRFLGRKLAFPRQETPVPLAGNSRSPCRKLPFPLQETRVSLGRKL
ncbi:hypothetical protein [uncultured Parabacteroides sp.]|uniref:hypothetical protein n=1 Tax=uncultured Parabacteroides sp. TaxID=512312 RepID=UPI0026301C52|nr:hypothetical protein [uncultured Parabacteroides sp.]